MDDEFGGEASRDDLRLVPGVTIGHDGGSFFPVFPRARPGPVSYHDADYWERKRRREFWARRVVFLVLLAFGGLIVATIGAH